MSESYGEDGFQGKMDFSKGADAVPGEPVGNGLVNSSVLQNGQQWCFRKDTDNFKREDVSLKFIKIMRFFFGRWVGTCLLSINGATNPYFLGLLWESNESIDVTVPIIVPDT